MGTSNNSSLNNNLNLNGFNFDEASLMLAANGDDGFESFDRNGNFIGNNLGGNLQGQQQQLALAQQLSQQQQNAINSQNGFTFPSENNFRNQPSQAVNHGRNNSAVSPMPAPVNNMAGFVGNTSTPVKTAQNVVANTPVAESPINFNSPAGSSSQSFPNSPAGNSFNSSTNASGASPNTSFNSSPAVHNYPAQNFSADYGVGIANHSLGNPSASFLPATQNQQNFIDLTNDNDVFGQPSQFANNGEINTFAPFTMPAQNFPQQQQTFIATPQPQAFLSAQAAQFVQHHGNPHVAKTHSPAQESPVPKTKKTTKKKAAVPKKPAAAKKPSKSRAKKSKTTEAVNEDPFYDADENPNVYLVDAELNPQEYEYNLDEALRKFSDSVPQPAPVPMNGDALAVPPADVGNALVQNAPAAEEYAAAPAEGYEVAPAREFVENDPLPDNLEDFLRNVPLLPPGHAGDGNDDIQFGVGIPTANFVENNNFVAPVPFDNSFENVPLIEPSPVENGIQSDQYVGPAPAGDGREEESLLFLNDKDEATELNYAIAQAHQVSHTIPCSLNSSTNTEQQQQAQLNNVAPLQPSNVAPPQSNTPSPPQNKRKRSNSTRAPAATTPAPEPAPKKRRVTTSKRAKAKASLSKSASSAKFGLGKGAGTGLNSPRTMYVFDEKAFYLIPANIMPQFLKFATTFIESRTNQQQSFNEQQPATQQQQPLVQQQFAIEQQQSFAQQQDFAQQQPAPVEQGLFFQEKTVIQQPAPNQEEFEPAYDIEGNLLTYLQKDAPKNFWEEEDPIVLPPPRNGPAPLNDVTVAYGIAAPQTEENPSQSYITEPAVNAQQQFFLFPNPDPNEVVYVPPFEDVITEYVPDPETGVCGSNDAVSSYRHLPSNREIIEKFNLKPLGSGTERDISHLEWFIDLIHRSGLLAAAGEDEIPGDFRWESWKTANENLEALRPFFGGVSTNDWYTQWKAGENPVQLAEQEEDDE